MQSFASFIVWIGSNFRVRISQHITKLSLAPEEDEDDEGEEDEKKNRF